MDHEENIYSKHYTEFKCFSECKKMGRTLSGIRECKEVFSGIILLKMLVVLFKQMYSQSSVRLCVCLKCVLEVSVLNM
jgi:hypothetical protein